MSGGHSRSETEKHSHLVESTCGPLATIADGADAWAAEATTVSGGTCAEGTYVTTGLSVASAFPGSFTIPTPSEGTKGLRIRYSYTTDGTCTYTTSWYSAEIASSGSAPCTISSTCAWV